MSIPALSPIPSSSQAELGTLRRSTRRWGNALRGVGRFLATHTKITAGLSIIGCFVLLAVIGPLLLRGDPNAFSNAVLVSPSGGHLLGTTQTGQDILTQLVDGTGTSLLIGFSVGVLGTIISVIVGLTAGFFGGLVDDLLSFLINIFLVLPALPLAIVLTAYFPFRGPVPLAIVVLLVSWAWGARVLRAQTLSLRKREFIEAARSSGESSIRLIFFEILPNELALVTTNLLGITIFAILTEVGLEYLGLGDITHQSWGIMLYWAQNNDALFLGAWWWFLPPGFCIAMLGAALALINLGVDEIANPRLRHERQPKKARLR
jgi:peptide/nickel transport system permease protein